MAKKKAVKALGRKDLKSTRGGSVNASPTGKTKGGSTQSQDYFKFELKDIQISS